MKNYDSNIDIINHINYTIAAEGIIPTCITPLLGNSNEPKYRINSRNGTFLAKLSVSKRFNENFNKLLYQNSDFCVPPIISKNISAINCQLNVYSWLDGKDLKTVLNNAESQENYKYGIKCGALLKRLHTVKTEDILVRFDIDEHLATLLDFLESNECKLKYKSFWYNYLCENISILKRDANKSIIHFDFKPKNIMLSNEKLFIVDFDSFSIGNPWFDFYDKGLAIYPQKQFFNQGIMDGYFEQNIPENFWQFFKAISVYGLVLSAFWNVNRTNVNYVTDVERYLLDSYCNFTIDVPVWYAQKPI